MSKIHFKVFNLHCKKTNDNANSNEQNEQKAWFSVAINYSFTFKCPCHSMWNDLKQDPCYQYIVTTTIP